MGRAVGAGRGDLFDHAVRTSNRLPVGTTAALCLLILTAGPWLIMGLTDLATVRSGAERYLPYAAIYVLVSVAAFQLDGIFIGATGTRTMRNASLAAVLAFLAPWWPLASWGANDGLWMAFIVFVVALALALAWRYPVLRASLR